MQENHGPWCLPRSVGATSKGSSINHGVRLRVRQSLCPERSDGCVDCGGVTRDAMLPEIVSGDHSPEMNDSMAEEGIASRSMLA